MNWEIVWQKPWPGIIIIFVGAISTCFTFYQFYDAEATSKLNESLNDTLQTKQNRIEELQNETIKQVLGGGYGKIVGDFISQQNGFSFKLENATAYPLLDICVTFTDMNEVMKLPHRVANNNVYLNRRQYMQFEKDVLLNASLSGKTHTSLNYFIPLSKEPRYIQTKVMCKHLITVQYSIITYNESNNSYDLSYKIYAYDPALDKLDRLLETAGPEFEDKVWEENFFLKKSFQLEGAKD